MFFLISIYEPSSAMALCTAFILFSTLKNYNEKKHSQPDQLEHDPILDRKRQYIQMEDQEKVKEGIVKKCYSDFSRGNCDTKSTE